jgi:hypothetical protein
MVSPDNGLTSDCIRLTCGYLSNSLLRGRPHLGGVPEFPGISARWLPVAVTIVPIICYRDGLPRPSIFKESRDQHHHDDGLRNYGHSL